jgi:hypothetical protein
MLRASRPCGVGCAAKAFGLSSPHNEEAVMLRSLSSLVALLLSLTAACTAFGAQRTFVATTGSDANTASNCSNTLPCRGFTAALTVTDAGGKIIVLTSGGYGPVTINKSVSLIAPDGIYAGISVFSGSGITIATAGVDVTLKGLAFNQLGGTNGIHMSAGNNLLVQNCAIKGFSFGYGIYVSGVVQVRILDSLLTGNDYHVYLTNGPSALSSNSRFLAGNFGVYAYASGVGVSTKVELKHSEASGTGNTAFYARAASSGRVEFNIKDAVVSNSVYGAGPYTEGGTALVSVSGSLVTRNSSYGLVASGA